MRRFVRGSNATVTLNAVWPLSCGYGTDGLRPGALCCDVVSVRPPGKLPKMHLRRQLLSDTAAFFPTVQFFVAMFLQSTGFSASPEEEETSSWKTRDVGYSPLTALISTPGWLLARVQAERTLHGLCSND